MTLIHDNRVWWSDAFTPYIASGGQPVVPSSSLTLDPFATKGYVEDGDVWDGIDQPAASVGPLTSGDGTYWVALARNRGTSVAPWTRQGDTHYAWQQNASEPAAPPGGGIVFSQVTVAGGAITAVVPAGNRSIFAPVPTPFYNVADYDVLPGNTSAQNATGIANA